MIVIILEPIVGFGYNTISRIYLGSVKIKISIDSSKIVSAGLFQTVLTHELGHALFNRRDLTGDIMDFHILQDPRGRLYQHVPFYNQTLKYHPFAHINGNGTIVPEFY